MTLYLSNGVYSSEIAIDATVPAGLTRAGAVVGAYTWGPVGEPVFQSNEETLVESHGLPDETNYKDWFIAHEFLMESGALRTVRVVGKGATNAVVGGAGNGLSLDINALDGEVVSVAIANAGSGYTAGDIVEIQGGIIASEVRVEQVDGAGAAVKLTLLSTGTGYQTASARPTESRTKFYVGTDYEFEEGATELPPIIARYPGELGNQLGVSIVRAAEFYGSYFEDRFPIAPASTTIYLDEAKTVTPTSMSYIVPVDVLKADDLTVTYENATLTKGTQPGQWNVPIDTSGNPSGELVYNTASETFTPDGKTSNFVVQNTYGLDLFSAVVIADGVTLQPRFDGVGAVPYGFFDIDVDTKNLTVGTDLYAASGDGVTKVFEITTSKTVTANDAVVTVDGVPYTIVSAAPDDGEVQITSIADGYSFEFKDAPNTGLRNVQIRWGFPTGNVTVILGRPVRANSLKLFANMTEVHALVFDATGKITGEANKVLESYSFLSLDPDAVREDGTSNFYARAINSRSRKIRVSETLKHFGEWKLGLGSNGAKPDDADYLAAYEVFRDSKDYEATYLIDIVHSRTVSLLLQELMEKRRDGVAYIGAPMSLTVNNRGKEMQDVLNYKRSLNPSNFSYMNVLWLYIYDRFNGKYRWIPATGTDAGMYAKTHNEINMWNTPGGYNRGYYRRAQKISWIATEQERDQLQPNGINIVVREKGSGFVLLSWQTMQEKTGVFQDMNVRYLAIYTRVQIADMVKYFIGEINDEITRAQVRNAINPFLAQVQAGRGIIDKRVRCDDKNNTPEVVDNRILKIDVYIKPSRLIGGIDLRMIFTKSGISFEEIILA